jgi:antitoxin MazE
MAGARELHGFPTERQRLALVSAADASYLQCRHLEWKGCHMRVTRWGNSLAVRIPKPLAEQVDIAEGCEVELTVVDGAITIRPKARSYSLEELLEQVTPENRHDEIDWGEPQGKEAW